jgi:hypothetical protein
MAFSGCNVSSIDGTFNHLCKLVGHLIITSDFLCGDFYLFYLLLFSVENTISTYAKDLLPK